jgi:hypothetical protein
MYWGGAVGAGPAHWPWVRPTFKVGAGHNILAATLWERTNTESTDRQLLHKEINGECNQGQI